MNQFMAEDSFVHCGIQGKSFTFSDGETIKLCGNPACTTFDARRREVLRNQNRSTKFTGEAMIITDKIRAENETVTTGSTTSNVYEREQDAYERGLAHPLEVEWEAEEEQEKFYARIEHVSIVESNS